jgi:hypothetical protein
LREGKSSTTAAPEAPSRGMRGQTGSDAIIRPVLAGSNGPPQRRLRGAAVAGRRLAPGPCELPLVHTRKGNFMRALHFVAAICERTASSWNPMQFSSSWRGHPALRPSQDQNALRFRRATKLDFNGLSQQNDVRLTHFRLLTIRLRWDSS